MIYPSTTSFTPLATLHLPNSQTLHPDACNPSMDLVVLLDSAKAASAPDPSSSISAGAANTLGGSGKGKEKAVGAGLTKVGLWRMSGSRVWEVDVLGKILGLAWSLDGLYLSLLVMDEAPPAGDFNNNKLSIEHLSVHTGSLIRSVPFPQGLSTAETYGISSTHANRWWKMEWRASGMEWETGRIGSSSSIIDSLPTVTPVEPPKPALAHPFMLPNPAASQSIQTPKLHSSLQSFPSLLPIPHPHPPDILHLTHAHHLLTGTFPLPASSPSRETLRLADISNRTSGFLDVVLRGLEGAESAFKDGYKQTLIWREEVEICAANEGISNEDVHADLFRLLIAGRSGPAVNEWLGNRLTGRTVTKWELALESSFSSIQKIISESVSPAVERVILLLEELRGWSLSTHYTSLLDLGEQEIKRALDLCVGLAKVAEKIRARAEHEQQASGEWFKWLKYEILRLQDSTNETVPLAVHDVKLTWSFLKNGFVSSVLLSNFPSERGNDDEKLEDVSSVLPFSPTRGDPPPPIDDSDLSDQTFDGDVSLDLSVDTSVVLPAQADSTKTRKRSWEEEPRLWSNSLVAVCKGLVDGALRGKSGIADMAERWDSGKMMSAERVIDEVTWRAYDSSSESGQILYIIQLSSETIRGTAISLAEQSTSCQAIQFFDGIELALVLDSAENEVVERYLATIDYTALELFDVDISQVRADWTIDDLIDSVLLQLPRTDLSISRSRLLKAPVDGEETVWIALNGRKGRRVGCILSGEGREVEVLDLEEDEEDEGDEDDGEEDEGGEEGEGQSMEGVEGA